MPFSELGLSDAIAGTAVKAGYTTATSIQSQAIPVLLEGRDLVGCSQTGTGKTAAFAMPLLHRLDLSKRVPQVLVLAPTRELATQVADSFREYGAQIKDLGILAIYGGAPYPPQLTALRRGVHVVVGTPGRVIDHIKQGALDLSQLKALVLDEADEMLQMGFIDDVKMILAQTPKTRQIALFSATMPQPIREIAREHLQDPVELKSASTERTAANIRQQFIITPTRQKIEILARVLEAETTEGVIVFVRTRAATLEVADALSARGFNTASLNGDIVQTQRQRTVNQLKSGEIDVLVATDVAARGLDVDRISHVINFDMPREHEAYVHRIGRTGRAGRTGCAISMVAPNAQRAIQHLSRAIGQQIEHIDPPTTKTINTVRAEKFKQQLLGALESPHFKGFASLITRIAEESGESPERLAAAAATLAHAGRPLFAQNLDLPAARPPRQEREPRGDRDSQGGREDRGRDDRGRDDRGGQRWQSYRVEVGRSHGIMPKHLVGAIANEAGLDGRDIGRIDIQDQFSLIDLPVGMPPAIFEILQATQVSGKPLQISEASQSPRPKRDFGGGGGGGDRKPGKRFGGDGPKAQDGPGKKFEKKKFEKRKFDKKKKASTAT